MNEYPDVTFRVSDSDTGSLSFQDWGLKLERIQLSFPEAKTDTVDIPGSNGLLDLTEVNGPVTYRNRTLQLTFSLFTDYQDWHALASRIAAAIHGKKIQCILPDDSLYYYDGRFKLETSKDSDAVTDVVITGDVGPYKIMVQSSTEDWLWDPFSFEDGVIMEYGNIEIGGSGTVTIIGSAMPVVPTIAASAAMTVEFEGQVYDLSAGNNVIYDIVIDDREYDLKFTGTGTVSIDYRGGVL